MPKPKIDRVKLNQMLREGKPQKEVAQFFGVSEGAISKAKKELNIAVVKNTALETAHQIVQKELDVVDQLYKSNKRINEIAEDLMAKIRGEKTGTLAVQGNIRLVLKEFEEERRKQLNFQMEIFKTLSDFKLIAEFQKEVVDLIGNANRCLKCGAELFCASCEGKVDLRTEIINKLKEAKALSKTVQLRP
jgi:uncharacterized protein YerC